MKLICLRWAAAWLLAAPAFAALAHGDEPHGDAPHPEVHAAAGPRFETATESFEMVGRLQDAVLTLFINRFDTNEPVLQAKVEIESGTHRATAVYQAQQGSYVVAEPKFIAALSQPGTHPLLVTLTAGNESDLLEASLTPAAPAAGPGGGRPRLGILLLAGGAGALVLGLVLWRTRRARAAKGASA